MKQFTGILLFFAVCTGAIGQVLPVGDGVLSSTKLLSVDRMTGADPESGPDGLMFCFLVSRTPLGQHKFAIKETRDFSISGKSYRELSQSALGRVFKPAIAVHDAAKYAIDHPELATVVAAAPQRSLIVTLAISGPKLQVGDDVKVILQVGFGRSVEKPEAESLVFETKVPE
jgi:hypothetical protein